MLRFHELQGWWLLYLVTSYTVFTLPEPVFSQRVPVTSNLRSSATDNRNDETNLAEPTGGGEEPIALASSHEINRFYSDEFSHSYSLEDPMFEEETFMRLRNKLYPRRGKPKRGPPGHRKPHKSRAPKKHPAHTSPKPILLKPSKLTKKPFFRVPKLFKNHRHPRPHTEPESDEERDNYRNIIEPLRRPRPPPRHHGHDHHLDDDRKFRGEQTVISSEQKGKIKDEVRKPSPPPTSTTQRPPTIRDDFFPSAHGDRPPNSVEVESPRGPMKDGNYPGKGEKSQASRTPTHAPTIYIDGHRPFPKIPRTVELSYFYNSKDGSDYRNLVQNHHLRRRKECDGLENFIYDLELVAFFLALITTTIGLYTDVIPFFNHGVKITYNNDLLGHGSDFPHDYWPKHDSYVDVPGRQRTISIGSPGDNTKEVLAVTGEFLGIVGLGISFLGLFPHLVEKFFYGLDWWFGKRGLWKQFLYTYKCEIHSYPKPGWGR